METIKLDDGRELTRVEDGNILTQKTKPFDQWYYDRTGSSLATDIPSLKMPQREKLFLQWKHGFQSEEANSAAEGAKKYIMSQFISVHGVAPLRGGRREYYKREILFENKCNHWRMILGLPQWNLPLTEEE